MLHCNLPQATVRIGTKGYLCDRAKEKAPALNAQSVEGQVPYPSLQQWRVGQRRPCPAYQSKQVLNGTKTTSVFEDGL